MCEVPIGNSPGWLKVVLLIVMDKEGSRSFRAAKSLRCLTGRFTELSESELPNLTVTGVTHPLMNFISAACAILRAYVEGGSLVEEFCVWLILSFWVEGGGLHRDLSGWREDS